LAADRQKITATFRRQNSTEDHACAISCFSLQLPVQSRLLQWHVPSTQWLYVSHARSRDALRVDPQNAYIRSEERWLCSRNSVQGELDLHCRLGSTETKLHGLSPRANYTDRVTAACRRSDCQLLRIEGAMWSA
jgi:hypothetical protein